MSSHSRYVNNLHARKVVEERWPQKPIVICDSKKCGEYNMLHCVRTKGHDGEHNYVVDHENDYPHNKANK